ncbi:hypothetical protein COOONC_09978 [Cooperia oncophora]
MVLPKVDRAVEVTQPYTGPLSVFALIYRTYGIIWQYIQDNRLETPTLARSSTIKMKSHLSIEALESRLAKKKFDSDEESSESEPDHQSEVENPDDGIVEIKEDAAAGDKKDN